MAFFVLFLMFLSSISLSSSEHNYKYSIGPVCECIDAAKPFGDYVKTCYRRCLMEPEPRGRATIQIHQTMDSQAGPRVIECSKILQKQSFTQTWSFSTVSSDIKTSTIPVTEEECTSAIRDNCPDYNCNHREKDDIAPEFHYASTTDVARETISLLTMPSSLMVESNEIMISPLSTPDLYRASNKQGTHDGKMYFWKDDVDQSTCPFKKVQSYGCDEYKGSDGSKYYMCSGGRFSVTPARVEDIAPKACPGLQLAKEGFLFKSLDVEAPDATHSRLYITQLQGMTGDSDYLRHKIQQLATHLDSEICSNQCEILSLESRSNTKDEVMARVGLNYYKLYSNGTATQCKPLTGCKLAKPLTICGNPPRVGVTCTTNSGLWNPLQPFMTPGGVCTKPDDAERLSFHLGTEEYVVDDDLTISAERNFSHGVYPTSFSDLHQTGIQLSLTDLQGIKPDWTGSKGKGSGISRNEKVSYKVNAPSVSVGSYLVSLGGKISGFFSNLEHAIGMIVLGLSSLIFIILLIKLIPRREGGNHVKMVPTVYTEAKSEEGRALWT